MKQFRLYGLWAILVLLVAACGGNSTPSNNTRFEPYPEEAQVLGLVNAFRSQARACGAQQFPAAPALTWVEAVGDTAWRHSVEMGRVAGEGHQGASTEDRLRAEGFDPGPVAEHRKKTTGPGNPNDAFNAWTADPAACANIMNPTFTVMGAGMSGQQDNVVAGNIISWTLILTTPRANAPAPAATLTVAPTTTTVTVGGAAVPFSATLTNSTSPITWTLTGPGSISGTTGANINYTPPTTGGAGTAILTAKAGILTATATITVNTPNVPTLDITPAQGTTTVGGAPVTFTATTNTNQTVGWALGANSPGSISNTTGATTTYTPPATGGAGTALLCAATSPTLSRCVNITINAPAPGLTLTPTNVIVKVGSAPVVITASQNVTWSMTGLPAAASWNATAFTYIPPTTGTGGTATITATAGNLTATATITVVTLEITPPAATVAVGGAALPFSATLTSSNATINWSLTGPGNISATTGTTTNYTPPTTGGAGTATLTATVGAVSTTATITIVPAGGLQVEIKDLQRQVLVPPFSIHSLGRHLTDRPVSPMTANPNGGAFILWTRQGDTRAFLTQVDGNGNAVGTDQDLGIGNAGAVGTDGTKVAYLLKTGTDQLLFKVVGGGQTLVVNNGNPAPWPGGDAFGNTAMLKGADWRRQAVLPVNGNWFTSFDHDNRFPGNDVHSAMSMVMLDGNGTNPTLGVPWGTSHSLDILALFDGTNILNIAVGDGFPHDFRLHVLTPQGQVIGDRIDLFAKNKFNVDGQVVDSVPGNSTGLSSGKLGGLSQVGANQFVLTYLIQPSDGLAAKINEIGMLVFDKQGNAQRFRIKDGTGIRYVRSARYGNNILVAWETTADKFIATVVSPQGAVVVAEQELIGGAAFSERDSFINLTNGDVMWSASVGGSLKVFRLPAP